MPDAPRRYLFVMGSARSGGSSETLARAAAASLPPGTAQDWKPLHESPLPAFHDAVPAGGSLDRTPEGHERVLLDATLRATDLVVVSPLYWYSVSASVKLYLDYWGLWMQAPAIGFRPRMRGKVMWAITAFGGRDESSAGPLLETLRRSAEYLDMRWGGAVVAPGGTGTGSGFPEAQARARHLFGPGPADRPRHRSEPVESAADGGSRP
ncbi:flavodoxin family protein [Actinoplanes sp. NPDC049265]|uniref:flavodoxin family protein n=1 Tax=Actinoplanes sp. NPDC049265 TaxID=3363902 RepID=UPI00371AC03C